jgi:hypothetical protein
VRGGGAAREADQAGLQLEDGALGGVGDGGAVDEGVDQGAIPGVWRVRYSRAVDVAVSE